MYSYWMVLACCFFFFRSLNKCKCCQWCVKHFTMHLMFLNLGFPFSPVFLSPLCCLTSLAINWCESFFIEGKRMMPQYLHKWSSVALCSFVSTEIQAIKKRDVWESLCWKHLFMFGSLVSILISPFPCGFSSFLWTHANVKHIIPIS